MTIKLALPVVLTRLIGTEFTRDVELDVKARFPAIRIHYPSTRFNLQYDPFRLNVVIDINNRVVRVTWG